MNRSNKQLITLFIATIIFFSVAACSNGGPVITIPPVTPSDAVTSPSATIEPTPVLTPTPSPTPTPEPTPEPTPTPEPIVPGTWDSKMKTYTNTSIGLEFTLPSRWVAYTETELEEYAQQNYEFGVLYDFFVYSLDYNIKVYMTFRALDGAFDGVNWTAAEIRQYLLEWISSSFEEGSEPKYDEQVDVEIGENAYIYLSIYYPKALHGVAMYQDIYLSFINDNLVIMTISLTGDKTKLVGTEVQKFLATLKSPAA